VFTVHYVATTWPRIIEHTNVL